MTSVPMGMETPDMIELRKKRIEDAMDQGGETPALYTILPEKKSSVGGAMMGSAHVYDTTAVSTCLFHRETLPRKFPNPCILIQRIKINKKIFESIPPCHIGVLPNTNFMYIYMCNA